MRTLVTGGAGFIGSAIAHALVARGDDVRVLDDLSDGDAACVPDAADLVVADIRDLDAIRPAFDDVEVVFHEAAIRSVPRSVDDPLPVISTNVDGTAAVLEAAAAAGVRRLVYASSSSAYGDVGDEVNVETLSPSPRSPYAVSKLAAEQLCRVATLLGKLSTVSLRYFNVFGPGQRPDSVYAAVFPGFIAALHAGVAPTVHGDGEQSRDFCFIDDVVAANLAAAAAGDEAGGAVVNVAGGDPRTVNQVLRAVATAIDTWIEPVHVEPRAGDIRATRADISRARDLLGWSPRARWDEAVAATVAGFTGVGQPVARPAAAAST